MPIATALPTLAHAQELPMATPNALGPALPPELTTSATAWPTAQGSLDAHRAAIGSDIATGTVDRLDVAWRFPITAIGGYGAVTATPWCWETPFICRIWSATSSPSTGGRAACAGSIWRTL